MRVRMAFWPATAATARGTIVLLQVRTEFIEKYFEVVGELRERGFAVLTLDWRPGNVGLSNGFVVFHQTHKLVQTGGTHATVDLGTLKAQTHGPIVLHVTARADGFRTPGDAQVVLTPVPRPAGAPASRNRCSFCWQRSNAPWSGTIP